MEQLWLAEEKFLINYIEKIENATAEDRQAASDLFGNVDLPKILEINGDQAIISVTGPLSKKGPCFLARLFGFGGTSFNDIIESLKIASDDISVKTIRLLMDTPGGEVSGTDDVFQAVINAKKKKTIVAENHGMIASGGYWIASAASKIIATSPASETGSIGVVAVAIDFSKAEEKFGIKRVTIVSKNAPNKRPDIKTKTGRDVIQERVDALERVFISRISQGRNLSIEHVEQNFGRGGLLIAQDPNEDNPDAISVGMIDSVESTIESFRGSGNNTQSLFVGTPTFQDFKVVDKPWDADAAIKRVRSKTGSNEKPSESYKKAFFYFDSKSTDKFGSYKLPFVDVVDGQLVAIKNGIFAADSAMGGARTGKPPKIPTSDRSVVQAHIDKYKAKVEKQKKKTNAKEMGMDLKAAMSEHPGIKAEVEAMVAQEVKKAVQSATDRISGENQKAIVCLGPDSKYPASIKSLAIEVLSGKQDQAALVGAMTVWDATQEERAQNTAATETNGQGETQAAATTEGSTDGSVTNEQELAAAAERLKS